MKARRHRYRPTSAHTSRSSAHKRFHLGFNESLIDPPAARHKREHAHKVRFTAPAAAQAECDAHVRTERIARESMIYECRWSDDPRDGDRAGVLHWHIGRDRRH